MSLRATITSPQISGAMPSRPVSPAGPEPCSSKVIGPGWIDAATGERRVAGAEVVDREGEPHSVQRVEDAHRALGVFHERRLRALELERRGRNAVGTEGLAHLLEETALLQLPQRQIHGHAARRWHGALPSAVIRANPVQHPVAELQDEVRFLGERHEVRRVHEAALG
jgi:hypothetical protein